MAGLGRNLSEALWALFYFTNSEWKSHIQMHIPIENKIHLHMPGEHTKNNDNYKILNAKRQCAPEVHSDRTGPHVERLQIV